MAARHDRVKIFGTDMVRHLTGGRAHGERLPFTIANGMQFGVQHTFGAPDMAGKNPPFSRLDAVR